MHTLISSGVFLNFVVFCSHEVDDGLGECCSQPEHQYGQHAEAVRGGEEQGPRKEGQRSAGKPVTEA